MNLQELTVTKQALRSQLQAYERITVCCHTCERYGETTAQQCAVHKATPPPEWLRGPIECAEWVFDRVPFNGEAYDNL